MPKYHTGLAFFGDTISPVSGVLSRYHCYTMVWYGMVWYGMVWYGMV